MYKSLKIAGWNNKKISPRVLEDANRLLRSMRNSTIASTESGNILIKFEYLDLKCEFEVGDGKVIARTASKTNQWTGKAIETVTHASSESYINLV